MPESPGPDKHATGRNDTVQGWRDWLTGAVDPRGVKKIPDRKTVGDEFTETNIRKYSLDIP